MNDSHTSSLIRLELMESFQALIASLDDLVTEITIETDVAAWTSLSEEEIAVQQGHRHKAARLFGTLWYEDHQDGRETLTCPGIVGATATTLVRANQVNNCKDRFKAAVLALKRLPKSQASNFLEELHHRHEDVTLAMRRMGAARLNLKQAYRHIPILTQTPIKIGFTWSKRGRTIQRTTVAEARKLLEKRLPTPEAQTAMGRLNTIPDWEILARVRSVCPHLRANVVFSNKKEGIVRRLIQAPLPIIIPLHPDAPLPDFVPVLPEPLPNQRLQRSDVKIEEEPFLPLIRIHRYRFDFRKIIKEQ